jgi:nucleolar complex protein 3
VRVEVAQLVVYLQIVRLINQLVKRREERLRPAALDCLLRLRIRDVDLDADNDLKHKKKQDEKHKKRIVNLSKKEKKVC